MCFGEEEKHKEKSKVKIGRSKEYVWWCVEEKKNINKRVDERKRDTLYCFASLTSFDSGGVYI